MEAVEREADPEVAGWAPEPAREVAEWAREPEPEVAEWGL